MASSSGSNGIWTTSVINREGLGFATPPNCERGCIAAGNQSAIRGRREEATTAAIERSANDQRRSRGADGLVEGGEIVRGGFQLDDAGGDDADNVSDFVAGRIAPP